MTLVRVIPRLGNGDHINKLSREQTSEPESIAQGKESDSQTRGPAVRQQGFAGFGEVVEQGLYWLMWALVLVGLAWGIFGP
jgi:hypothetical protein